MTPICNKFSKTICNFLGGENGLLLEPAEWGHAELHSSTWVFGTQARTKKMSHVSGVGCRGGCRIKFSALKEARATATTKEKG